MKVRIKKDSEAAKTFESLREEKREFKENVESGKSIPPTVKEKLDRLTEELRKVYKMAEEAWVGCDGCDENDKHFWMKGFQTGYYRGKIDEIPDDVIEQAAANLTDPNKCKTENWIEGAKWYVEQLKNTI
jgi:hypothetical protein